MASTTRPSPSSMCSSTHKTLPTPGAGSTSARSAPAASCAAMSCRNNGSLPYKCRCRPRIGRRRGADGQLKGIRQGHMLELPRYAGSKPGELWVLRTNEGSIELVSSDFQPNHPDWPGRVKGWHEPSLDYQRERWALKKRAAEQSVKSIECLLKELKENPGKEPAKLGLTINVTATR